MDRIYQLNSREAELAFKQVASHMQALKNWIASAVEEEQFPKAKRLVVELREYQALFAKLNVDAHEMETNHD